MDGLLAKILEGWGGERRLSSLEVKDFTDTNIQDLLAHRQTVVVRDSRRYFVRLAHKPIAKITGDDFEIVELP